MTAKKTTAAKARAASRPRPEPPREEYLLEAARVARRLAPAFLFGCRTVDDIVQECVVLAAAAWDGGDYDRTRRAAPFLRVHLANKLRTLFRAEVWRAAAPCPGCAAGAPCGVDRDGRPAECGAHRRWTSHNCRKGTLARPAFAADRPADREVDGGHAAVDLADLLDALPAALRPAARMLMDDDRAAVPPDIAAELRRHLEAAYTIHSHSNNNQNDK